jgi:hypothetical protein
MTREKWRSNHEGSYPEFLEGALQPSVHFRMLTCAGGDAAQFLRQEGGVKTEGKSTKQLPAGRPPWFFIPQAKAPKQLQAGRPTAFIGEERKRTPAERR